MKKLVALTTAALVAVVATSAPANATKLTYQITNSVGDFARVTAGYTANHGKVQQYRRIEVHDGSCDGVRAYAQYQLDGHPSTYYLLYDHDGCKGPANAGWAVDWSDLAVSIDRFRLGRGTPPHVAWTGWRDVHTTVGS